MKKTNATNTIVSPKPLPSPCGEGLGERLFDITASLFGLIFLSPLLFFVSIWIKLDTKGNVFFRQSRVGRHNVDFRIFKFRTMHTSPTSPPPVHCRTGCDCLPSPMGEWKQALSVSPRTGGGEVLLTIGNRDSRITRAGYYIRKYKIDEIPQLLNVLVGDMSLVGPRPEVRKYVDLYTPEQMKVLSVRPGITDLASIKYRNENEILGNVENAEEYYKNVILQDKLKINLEYIEKRNFWLDLKLIFKTVFSIGK